MEFTYLAKNHQGEQDQGTISASNEKQALAMLGKQNLNVLEIRNTGQKTGTIKNIRLRHGVSLKEKIIFTICGMMLLIFAMCILSDLPKQFAYDYSHKTHQYVYSILSLEEKFFYYDLQNI